MHSGSPVSMLWENLYVFQQQIKFLFFLSPSVSLCMCVNLTLTWWYSRNGTTALYGQMKQQSFIHTASHFFGSVYRITLTIVFRFFIGYWREVFVVVEVEEEEGWSESKQFSCIWSVLLGLKLEFGVRKTPSNPRQIKPLVLLVIPLFKPTTLFLCAFSFSSHSCAHTCTKLPVFLTVYMPISDTHQRKVNEQTVRGASYRICKYSLPTLSAERSQACNHGQVHQVSFSLF